MAPSVSIKLVISTLNAWMLVSAFAICSSASGSVEFGRSGLIMLGFWLTNTVETTHVRPYAPYVVQKNTTELLIARAIAETEIWKSVNGIFKRLETTTCGTEAATRLYSACKAFDKDSSEDKDTAMQIDKLRTLYGVRMCICETGKGGARIPSTCQEAARMSSLGESEKSRLNEDLNLADNLRSCIGNLQKEHYLWTSYSNNIQDAMTLCDASRYDIDNRRLRDLHNDIMGSFHSFGEFLDLHQEVAERWLNQAEERAHMVGVVHSEALDNLSKDYEKHADLVSKNFQIMRERAKAASDAVTQIEQDAAQILIAFYKNAENLNSGMDVVKDNMARFYSGAADDFVDLINNQMADIQEVGILISNILDTMDSGTVAKFQEELMLTYDQWHTYAQYMHVQQGEIMDGAAALSNLTQDTVKHQYEARDMAYQASQSMRDVTVLIAEMEKPFQIMGTMYEAYISGRFRCIAIEICIMGFFLTSASLIFMFRSIRQWAALIVLSYIWIQCLRLGLSFINIAAKPVEAVTFITRAIKEQPRLIAVLCATIPMGFLIHQRQLWCARKKLARLDRKRREAFTRGLIARGGRSHPDIVSLRAGTTPPGL